MIPDETTLMTKIAFDIDCPPFADLDLGSVKVSTTELRGYWEWPDGTEGGELLFEKRDDGRLELIDYDGAFFLPATVVLRLRAADIVVGSEFD